MHTKMTAMKEDKMKETPVSRRRLDLTILELDTERRARIEKESRGRFEKQKRTQPSVPFLIDDGAWAIKRRRVGEFDSLLFIEESQKENRPDSHRRTRRGGKASSEYRLWNSPQPAYFERTRSLQPRPSNYFFSDSCLYEPESFNAPALSSPLPYMPL